MLKNMNEEQKSYSYFKITKKLALPLSLINIKTFFYFRAYRNHSFFILSNEQFVLDHFATSNDIGEHLTTVINGTTPGKILVNLWHDKEDNFLNVFYKLKIWNGISISLCLNDYVDVFGFAKNINDEKNANFYLEHFCLLKRFIIYFRLKGRKIIDSFSLNYTKKFSNSIKLKNEYNNRLESIRQFRKLITPEKLVVRDGYLRKTELTRQETACLLLLLEGRSMRKISEELKIPMKKVESYLENIKIKTGSHTKTSLLSNFFNNQIYQSRASYDHYRH